MSISTIVTMVCIVVLIYSLVLPDDGFSKKVSGFVTKHIFLLGFLITFGAMVSSLVYSNFIGYAPCLLCWYGRIAFYPQALIYGIALKKRDNGALNYSLGLTIFGLLISGYHYVVESFQYSPLPCSAGGVSCLTRYVYMYGFITIPFMELVFFLAIFFAVLVAKRGLKSSVLQTA